MWVHLFILLLSVHTPCLSFRPNRPKPRPFFKFKDGSASSQVQMGKGFGNAQSPSTIANWCYGNSEDCGEQKWGKVCVNGTHQSPIDLPYGKGTKQFTGLIKQFPSSKHVLEGYTLFNNGDNLEIYPEESDSENTPSFFWKAQNASYQWHSVDFHWGVEDSRGSEHSINGKKFAMEIQFIYFRSDIGSFEEALYRKKTPNALAAVSILLEAEESAVPLKVMETIISNLEKVTEPARVDFEGSLDFQELFKFQKAYHYLGSLPNPPCTQNVAWLVRSQSVKVPPDQLKPFRELKDRKGEQMVDNFRGTKKKKSHKVSIYKIVQDTVS